MSEGNLDKIIGAMEEYQATGWGQFPDLDLYMDQVITYLKQQLDFFHDSPDDNLITHSIINNYVKSGLMERPVKKKYAKSHLARLIITCLLKRVMSIEQVKKLVRADEGPTDKEFYESFCRMHEEVLGEEAQALREYSKESETPPDALELAMRYALKANTDRLIADRILEAVRNANAEDQSDNN